MVDTLGMRTVQLNGRLVAGILDGPDAGTEPDAPPLVGYVVRLTPTPTVAELHEAVPPTTVFIENFEVVTDTNGVIQNPKTGESDIRIPADFPGPGGVVRRIRWKSEIRTPTGKTLLTKEWVVPLDATAVDLTTIEPVPGTVVINLDVWEELVSNARAAEAVASAAAAAVLADREVVTGARDEVLAHAELFVAPAKGVLDDIMGGDVTEIVPTLAGKVGKAALPVNVRDYGAVGDGATDDSAAFATALLASNGRTLSLPHGIYLIASATRLKLAGLQSSIAGDPSGIGSHIKFTHPSGGLDIGDGAVNTYETRLSDVLISGSNATTTLIRARRVYEPHFSNLRVEQADPTTGVLLLLDDCGQLDAERVVFANAPVGIKTTGTISPITNIRLGNFYNLGEVLRVAGTSLSRLLIRDSWAEACDTLVALNNPGGPISIGELALERVRILKVAGIEDRSGNVRLLKAVASTSINTQDVNFSNCYVEAGGSTAPLVDFTGYNNTAGIFKMKMRDTYVAYSNVGAMIQTHPDQAWYTFIVDVRDINGVEAGKYLGAHMVNGWLRPSVLWGSGSPESVVAAVPGSTYQRSDASEFYPAFYVKQSGTGNTGWKAVTTG